MDARTQRRVRRHTQKVGKRELGGEFLYMKNEE